MTAPRSLIVNADDFGQSPGVNRGVIEAHERGIVTSASLMVRWPAAESAAAYARVHPSLTVGIHVDLGEWVFREATWVPIYEVVPRNDRTQVTAEISRQLNEFGRLMGRQPTHIDSHQHVHREEPVRSILRRMARELGVPLRGNSRRVRYRGDFYGQTEEGSPLPELISVEHLMAILNALPGGVTELGCHPGLGDDLETMYRTERTDEVNVLCDARVRAAITSLGIRLCGANAITDR
jgi:predicted glycoside hydrolase/deacetylase ChbG (UPF0249 family)